MKRIHAFVTRLGLLGLIAIQSSTADAGQETLKELLDARGFIAPSAKLLALLELDLGVSVESTLHEKSYGYPYGDLRILLKDGRSIRYSEKTRCIQGYKTYFDAEHPYTECRLSRDEAVAKANQLLEALSSNKRIESSDSIGITSSGAMIFLNEDYHGAIRYVGMIKVGVSRGGISLFAIHDQLPPMDYVPNISSAAAIEIAERNLRTEHDVIDMKVKTVRLELLSKSARIMFGKGEGEGEGEGEDQGRSSISCDLLDRYYWGVYCEVSISTGFGCSQERGEIPVYVDIETGKLY